MAEVYRLKSLILIKHEIQNGIGANSLLTGLCYPEITAASVLRRNSWHTPRPRTTGSQSEFSRHPSWGLSKEVQSRVSLGELLAYRRHQRSWHRMRPPKAVVFKPRVCIYNVSFKTSIPENFWLSNSWQVQESDLLKANPKRSDAGSTGSDRNGLSTVQRWGSSNGKCSQSFPEVGEKLEKLERGW